MRVTVRYIHKSPDPPKKKKQSQRVPLDVIFFNDSYFDRVRVRPGISLR